MYTPAVQEFINICQWAPTKFFFISENVFDPFIYYSHLLPLILSLLLGIFILWKNPKLLTSRILFAITAGFGIWVFFDLILWATGEIHQIMALWSIVNLVEVFIYAACFYFLQVFIHKKDSSLKSKLILLVPLLPVLFLTPTNLSLSEYDLSNCWREAVEGPLTHYNYIIEIIFVLAMVVYGMEMLRRVKDRAKKKKIIFVTLGVVLFLLTLSWGNLVGTFSDNWQMAQWGLFGMPIFAAFLGYLIVKYEEFNIKLIGAQALVAVISILVISEYFFVQTFGNRILISITLFFTLAAGMVLIRGVKREVEQRERLEKITKALGEANVKLEKADQLKDEFLSFASHDLKSPITKVKQWTSLILDGSYKEASEIKEIINKIHNTSDKSLRMVEEFLNIRKIEEGHMEYNFEEKDIVGFIHSIVADFDPIAKDKKINLSFHTELKTLKAKFDVIKLGQVLENLIDNSFKYTPKGSIKVQLLEEQKSILIKIIDTGLGIPKELLPQLFEQFRRASNEVKKIQGTGLGLFIAKKIIRAHKGEVWAESEGKDKGSTFLIRLPK